MPKKRDLFLKVVVVFVACLIAAVAVTYLYDKVRLQRMSSITNETGLVLPSGTKIIATSTSRYSLADGENFGWLLDFPGPITDWLLAQMKREDDDGVSWKHVQTFAEIAPQATESVGKSRLDSVWRAARTVRGKDETSYLYVAEGRTNGWLETFRP